MKRAWSRKRQADTLKQEKSRLVNLPLSERLPALKRQLAQDMKLGNKGEIIIEFADMILADAETLALSRLADVNGDLDIARADYRAALALYQKVQNAVYQGKLAESKLKSLNEREGN